MLVSLKTFLCAVLLSFLCSTAAFAVCKTGEPEFNQTYRGSSVDATSQDLDDYARIHVDAEDPACAAGAMYALRNKLESSLSSGSQPLAFQRWLDGYNVALIFAAAQRLGALGWATKELEQQLDGVEQRYQVVGDPAGQCSNEGMNTCIDDHAGAAAAYAWMAANKYRRMESSTAVTAMKNLAIQYIRRTLTESCFHNPAAFASGNKMVVCNGQASELASGASVTMSVNHGGQKIPYGFGLMTSISSAILGLKAAGTNYRIPGGATNGYQKEIAIALFQEAQRHVDSGSNFKNDCASPHRTNTNTPWDFPILMNRPCGGEPNSNPYHPNMYRLKEFYVQQFGTTSIPTLGTYRSDNFNANLFNTAFFGYGRKVTYGTHGYEWVVSTPEWMPFDNHDPIGYFEGISPTGVAQGWACDKDTAVLKGNGRIKVDLYDQFDVKYEGWADAGSEAAVNNQCAGVGTAHRFWIQLPASSKGRTIRAYGLDYTWFGTTLLPCLQSPKCSW